MERHKRLTGGEERGGIRARGDLLAQRYDRKEAEDSHGDKGAFNDTSGDVSKG
jgi:hypothetical protein